MKLRQSANIALVAAMAAVLFSPLAASAAPVPHAASSGSNPPTQPLVSPGVMAQVDQIWSEEDPFPPPPVGGIMDSSPSPATLPTDRVSNFVTALTITREPGNDGLTTWRSSFWTVGHAYRGAPDGYISLQQRGGANKVVEFSMNNFTGWVNGPNSQCFAVGTGAICSMAYPWVAGETYRLSVSHSPTNPDVWNAFITPDTGTAIFLGGIRVFPQSEADDLIWRMAHTVEFTGVGSDEPSTCAAVAASTAIFRTSAEGERGGQTHTFYPYESRGFRVGPCAGIAKATCGSKGACIASVNEGALPQRVRLQNPASGLCLDLLGSGEDAGLWHCTTDNANQIVNQADNRQLEFAYRNAGGSGSLCLYGTYHRSDHGEYQVAGLPCTPLVLDPDSQWVYRPQTSQWINVGTGLCLATRSTALSSLLTVAPCQVEPAQQWNNIL